MTARHDHYRVHIRMAHACPATAPFAHYGDADEWARAYARSQVQPCEAWIVSHPCNIAAACYVGDGRGSVTSNPMALGAEVLS